MPMPDAPSSPSKKAKRSSSSANICPSSSPTQEMPTRRSPMPWPKIRCVQHEGHGRGAMGELKSHYAGQMDFGKASAAVKANSYDLHAVIAPSCRRKPTNENKNSPREASIFLCWDTGFRRYGARFACLQA